MRLKYSIKADEKKSTKIVRAMGRDMNISFKDAVMVADKIRGMKLKKALTYLEGVSELKKTVPYPRYNKGIGHRKGNTIKSSKYPQKVAKHVIGVLKNIEANAEFKGLDLDKVKLSHVQAQKGIDRKRRKPTGRWGSWTTQYVHFQIIAEEI